MLAKIFKLTSFVSLAVMSGNIFAATTHCSDPTQRLKYLIDYADGGAPRASLSELSLDSEVLFKTTFDGENEIRKADYTFDTESQNEIDTHIERARSLKTTWYTVKLEVKPHDRETPGFSELVFCKDVRSLLNAP